MAEILKPESTKDGDIRKDDDRDDELKFANDKLKRIIEEEFVKKEKGEDYDFHFIDIKIEGLKKEDILYYGRLIKADTKEDLENLLNDLNEYMRRVEEEVINRLKKENKEQLRKEKFSELFGADPRINFFGFLHNEIAHKGAESIREELRKLKKLKEQRQTPQQ